MKLEYKQNLQDYQDANQSIIRSRILSYIFRLIFSFFFLIAFTNMILRTLQYIVQSEFEITHILQALFSACFSAIPLFYIGMLIFPIIKFNPILKFKLAHLWSKQLNEQESKSLELSEEGIVVKSISVEESMKWTVYLKVIETKRLFVLFVSQFQFQMIPKRAFLNDAQIRNFRDLLSEKIS